VTIGSGRFPALEVARTFEPRARSPDHGGRLSVSTFWGLLMVVAFVGGLAVGVILYHVCDP
jgi:hypothetical protein